MLIDVVRPTPQRSAQLQQLLSGRTVRFDASSVKAIILGRGSRIVGFMTDETTSWWFDGDQISNVAPADVARQVAGQIADLHSPVDIDLQVAVSDDEGAAHATA